MNDQPNSDERGFTLVEMLISLTILVMAMAGLYSMLIENSRINRQQQMTAEVQSNARNTLSLIVQKLRSAGWDPQNVGLSTVTLDPDLSDSVSELEIFADLDADGDTDSTDEQILIRHVNNQVVVRRDADPSTPFEIVAADISNDADGDGVIEPMFIPDADPPTRITVQVTARSPVRDPQSGDFIRYTVSSDVVLRKDL